MVTSSYNSNEIKVEIEISNITPNLLGVKVHFPHSFKKI